jgi:K+-transporting ATPase ATPase C chain
MEWFTHIVVALRMTVLTGVLTGLLYPLAITGAAQLAFPAEASGSLLEDEGGAVVGSGLVGQRFSEAHYFTGRPSASGYDGRASGGSNLAVTSRTLAQRAAADIARLVRENPRASPVVPADLVSASGSGLDPDISPEAAMWQAPRIADARGVDSERVAALVRSEVVGREGLILGEPRVNVLRLNLALDRHFGRMGPHL